MSRQRPWEKKKIPCSRCGRLVEDDRRRYPPFCRDCMVVDRGLYEKWNAEFRQEEM